MVMALITGVPGSGKSFYLVHEIEKNFVELHEKSGHYHLKKSGENEQYLVVTNLADLRLPHYDLEQLIEESGADDIIHFFTYQMQEKVGDFLKETKGKGVISYRLVYIIDEAQQYFRDTKPVSKLAESRSKVKDYSNECIFYFEKHRHLGHTIYLAAQDAFRISKHVGQLVEWHYRFLRRSSSLLGNFRCVQFFGYDGAESGTFTVKKDQKIFDLYKSFDAEEAVKPKSVFIKPLLSILFLSCILIAILYYLFAVKFGDSNKDKVKELPNNSQPVSYVEQKEKSHGNQSVISKVLHSPDSKVSESMTEFEKKIDVKQSNFIDRKIPGINENLVQINYMYIKKEIHLEGCKGQIYPIDLYPADVILSERNSRPIFYSNIICVEDEYEEDYQPDQDLMSDITYESFIPDMAGKKQAE